MMNYREKQRDFEKRAKARTVVYVGRKPLNIGRNAAKRTRDAAYATARGCPGGWKRAVRSIIIAAKKAGTVWPAL